MALDKSTLLRYYKRKDVQDALVAQACDKEIGFRYGEGFGKRPDVLTYPRDALEVVMRGGTSFHASCELWKNPLALNNEMKRADQDALRSGWDLLLDIDCSAVEYSKICAELVCAFLTFCDCETFSVKFSGNKGFHIGIPFEAFPARLPTRNGELETKSLFPEAPRKIAFYVKENIKEALARKILEFEGGDISRVAAKVGLSVSEIIISLRNADGGAVGVLNVEKFLEIDTVLLSSRHLYRLAYSLHEKSGLLSLPLTVAQLKTFERNMASPDVLGTMLLGFMDRGAVRADSARRLLTSAYDFEVKFSLGSVDDMNEEIRNLREKEKKDLLQTVAIPVDFFPPCMKRISEGLEDGKKRALFCVMPYLGKIGWSREQIDVWVKDWNSRQREPLREVYLKGQFAHFVPGEKMGPNCEAEAYYKGIGVCHPDSFCHRIKNPANYSLFKFRMYEEQREELEKEEAKEIKRIENERKKTEREKRKGVKLQLEKMKEEKIEPEKVQQVKVQEENKVDETELVPHKKIFDE